MFRVIFKKQYAGLYIIIIIIIIFTFWIFSKGLTKVEYY